MTARDGGGIYADYIEKELDHHRASQSSIEQRSVAVVSTVGVLITVLFGFAAIAKSGDSLQIPDSARLWFYAALISFVGAVVSALVVSIPRQRVYRGPKPDALERVAKKYWGDSAERASQRVAATRVVVLRSYIRGNAFKSGALQVAIRCEVAGVLFLAIAIALVLHET